MDDEETDERAYEPPTDPYVTPDGQGGYCPRCHSIMSLLAGHRCEPTD